MINLRLGLDSLPDFQRDHHAHTHFRLLTELAPALQETVRFPGTVRVIVVENRYARIPFPEDLFHEPFDQRWGWHDDWCGPTWIGTTLETLSDEGVPFFML